MGLTLYTLRQLIDAGKAVVRGLIDGIATERGTDVGDDIEIAAQMLQGAQVAAVYAYDNLFPADADAQRRDDLVDQYGLKFEKEATKSRGLIVVGVVTSDPIPAGTKITFSADHFHDGKERTFVTLEDGVVRPNGGVYLDWTSYKYGEGSTEDKIRIKDVDGVKYVRARDAVLVKNAGAVQLNAVKRVNWEDVTLELQHRLLASPVVDATDGIVSRVAMAVVEVECSDAGSIGNIPVVAQRFPDATDATVAFVLEVGGGGEAVSAIDKDERVIRLLEDTIAMPPDMGNLQHIRELVLSCPDVDLDDAVVYQHARGPGTLDVVCVGRSGRSIPAAFSGAHTEFTIIGSNFRRIGEVQARKIKEWLTANGDHSKSKLSYFDDIEVRSVEWDWAGEHRDVYNDLDLAYISSGALDVFITPQPGFGPDSGFSGVYVPHTSSLTKLYPATNTSRVDTRIKAGHRVWVRVNVGDQRRHGAVTVVTTVSSVDPDGSFLCIPTLAGLTTKSDLTLTDPVSADDSELLTVGEWGTAGPLTQPVIDAVYSYYDALGPGSYFERPLDPGYLRVFRATGVIAPYPGMSIRRWPSEGRRWSSGLRMSELEAKIVSVEGVRGVTFGRGGVELGANQSNDFDPVPFHTLALPSCAVRYA